MNVQRWAARGQRGFTLVELMVALVVGSMVIAALLAGYYAISVSSRHTRAMTQMTDDAAAALSILRGQLTQAGYSRPTGPNAKGFQRLYTGKAVMGCDGDFNDLSVAIGALTCKDTTGNDNLKDSVAVSYEADASNSLQSGGTPLDCLGNSLTQLGTAPNTYWVSYSRFYVATGAGSRTALFCRGDGNPSGQALVENIEDLQIQYGVSNDLTASPARVAYYAKAVDAAMDSVIAVRLCVLVASADEVMDEKTDYYNCQDTKVTPGDKRMYRSFRSTVLLPNRLGAV